MKNLVAATALALAAVSAHATVLFTNGTDAAANGGYCSSCDAGSWRMFDKFTLAQDSTLTGVSLSASVGNGFNGIDVSIWSSAGSGELYSKFTSNSKLGYGTWQHIEFHDDLPNWTLAAGTYWISFYGAGLMMPTNTHVDNSAVQIYMGNTKYARGMDVPFTLEGNAATSVPEPASLALVALGLAGMGAAARRRRK